MDENLKRGIRRLARDAETGIARSILRWKYRRETGTPPEDGYIETRAKTVADAAHQVIAERGRNVWQELKKVYAGAGTGKDSEK